MNGPTHLSAITLGVSDMARAVAFYDLMGFERRYGGTDAPFTSYVVGTGFVNLQLVSKAPATGWGRVIVHVGDVDATHRRAVDAGLRPEDVPRDAPWGERFFHLHDPDGHELSFARPLAT